MFQCYQAVIVIILIAAFRTVGANFFQQVAGGVIAVLNPTTGPGDLCRPLTAIVSVTHDQVAGVSDRFDQAGGIESGGEPLSPRMDNPFETTPLIIFKGNRSIFIGNPFQPAAAIVAKPTHFLPVVSDLNRQAVGIIGEADHLAARAPPLYDPAEGIPFQQCSFPPRVGNGQTTVTAVILKDGFSSPLHLKGGQVSRRVVTEFLAKAEGIGDPFQTAGLIIKEIGKMTTTVPVRDQLVVTVINKFGGRGSSIDLLDNVAVGISLITLFSPLSSVARRL